MPPSGFSDKAVKGLLVFLEACYEDLLGKMNSGKEPEEIIEKELNDIRTYLSSFDVNSLVDRK